MENKDLRDHRDLQDLVVCPVHLGPLAAQLNAENKDNRDHLACLDLMDHLDSLVCAERMDNLDNVESLD